MEKLVKVAVDAMGGDHAPGEDPLFRRFLSQYQDHNTGRSGGCGGIFEGKQRVEQRVEQGENPGKYGHIAEIEAICPIF